MVVMVMVVLVVLVVVVVVVVVVVMVMVVVVLVVVIMVVVVGSAANAELLQHTKKICKARSAVVHAGAIFIPDQKGVVWRWACEELTLSSWNGLFFASSLVDDSM
mgnify:CR=1 FL=1